MVDIATLAIAVDSSDLQDGTRRLDRMGDQAVVTGRQVQQSTRQMTRGFSTTATAARGMSMGLMGGANGSRMLAMQLSQVAQQGQATGNYLQALAIQGADIGMMFGTIGIAVGVAAGALLPLAANLIEAANGIGTFEDAIEGLEESTAELRSELFRLQQGLDNLSQVEGLREIERIQQRILELQERLDGPIRHREARNLRIRLEAEQERLALARQLLEENQRTVDEIEDFNDGVREAGGLLHSAALSAADLANNLAAARRSAMSGFDIAGEVILDPRDPRYDPVAVAFDEFSRVPTTRPQPDRVPHATGGGRIPAIREITVAHQMAASAIAEAERAAVTYADVQAELNAMLAAGDIDATSYAAALEIAREQLESATDATSLWASEQRRLQDGILDAIEGGENLSDVFRDVARSIARAAAEAALFNSGPLAGMFSGGSMNFGGFFGGLFGGFRANGGPVSSGQAYVVGERGPELFVPNQGGQIVPNGAAQSGGNTTNVTVNYSFQGGITEADLGRALPVLVERTKREVVDAVQRGGAVARVLR